VRALIYAIIKSILKSRKIYAIIPNMGSILEQICRCRRCGHEWVKRVMKRPVRCPNCKQPKWDIPAGKLRMGRPPMKKGKGKKA
jgi:predicted Zn-ribbon and HTH transcriptional regulator